MKFAFEGYKITCSVWCTSSISSAAASDTTHLSEMKSKSTTWFEEILATSLPFCLPPLIVNSCIHICLINRDIPQYLQGNIIMSYKLTSGTEKSHFKSKFLAFAKISFLFPEAKWTSTFSAKLLSLSSFASAGEININSFNAPSNLDVLSTIFWNPASFEASLGTTWEWKKDIRF